MTKLLFGILTVGLLTSQGVAGQSKPESIQGVWQAVEVTITGPGARTIAIREPRPNLTIITAKHYSRVEVQAAWGAWRSTLFIAVTVAVIAILFVNWFVLALLGMGLYLAFRVLGFVDRRGPGAGSDRDS